jgi:peroxiredoxin
VFSLPGAFTPTCSNKQCPAFDRAYDRICELGVDDVYCVGVNDAFVMFNWARSLDLKNVKLIPDGSDHFTRRMGMLINNTKVGTVRG